MLGQFADVDFAWGLVVPVFDGCPECGLLLRRQTTLRLVASPHRRSRVRGSEHLHPGAVPDGDFEGVEERGHVALSGVDESPRVVAALVTGLEQHALAEMVAGDVGDGRAGGGALPVGVQDERVVRAVEDASGLCGAAVLGSQTVGVVVAGEKGVLDGVECVRNAGRVVDSPELLRSGVRESERTRASGWSARASATLLHPGSYSRAKTSSRIHLCSSETGMNALTTSDAKEG